MANRKPLSQTPPQDLGAFALIVCAAFVAYLPALRGGMLWDDAGHVTRLDLRPLHGLWRIWAGPGATQQYYPLLHSAFWVEHSIWGDSVLFYHLVNVALHALAACLVVKIVRRLALPGARLAGLMFALHPLCVEAVAWISEQKSTLSGVFYLASALAYLKFDESRKRSAYLVALGWFAAALLTKTVTATLPGALLVLLWWRRGRIEWKRDVQPLLPWFVAGASAGLFTAWVESTLIGAKGADFVLTPVQRWLLAGRVIWFYAGRVIWPVNLTFFYSRWNIDASAWWQYLFPAGAIAVAVALWRVARRNRGPVNPSAGMLAGFLIFAGTLFPVLGFFNIYPFRYSYVADHFAYLAILGILVPLASALSMAAEKMLPGNAVRPLLAMLLAGTMGAATWRQSAIYRDEETLYRATLERNPGAWLAHNNLANLLLTKSGRGSEAMSHLRAALRLKPDFPEAHLSMGNALLEKPGRLDDAIAEYETAARLAPGSERVHTNLGNALLQKGQTREAIAQLQEALRIDPANAEAHNDLGNALAQIPGDLPDAIAQYRLALSADPGFAEAHNNLGRALAQAPGRLAEAIAEFQAAIRLKPHSWSAHSNLGNAFSLVPGRLDDAVAEYRTALGIRPDSAAAHNNLGYALSQKSGSLSDAVSEYRAALGLNPDSADAHYNLGAALLQMPGQQQEALAEFEAVLRLKPSPRMQQIVDRLRTRK
jgi:tetratricopeptide (TPR) repeat protein